VRDRNGQQLAYIYFEDKRRLKKPEASPRTLLNSALSHASNESAGVASNIAKLPVLLHESALAILVRCYQGRGP
jgi:hypothetical protein